MTKSTKQGFTLIELMITVTVALIVVLAITEVYANTRQTTQIQAMQSRLTEDGRFALSMIQRVISQAGFRQSPATALPSDRISPSSTTPTTSVTLKFEADGANIMSCDGTTPAAGTQLIATIRQDGTKLRCDSETGTVTDWIAESSSGRGNATQVADFRITYGVDTSPSTTPAEYGCGTISGVTAARDCVADTYLSALTPAQTTDQITAVKVCLVIKTEATNGGITKNSAVKDCTAADIPDSQNDHRLYRTFRSTIMLRNR